MTESGTATALLDAAEALFGERGVDSASLRAIMRDAGANPAAIHYHYGSRDALARAVLDRVLAPLQARRLQLLDDALDDPDAPPSVARLLEALIRPDFEAVVEGGRRSRGAARLIGAIYARPSAFVEALVAESFAPVAARFTPHLAAALPELDRSEIAWRIRWAVFGILGALLSDDDTTITADRLEAELARVLAVTVAAVAAPASGGAVG